MAAHKAPPSLGFSRQVYWSGGVISFSNAWKWKVKVKPLRRVRLLVTPWTAAYQALRSWDFPGKRTGVGCHCLLRICWVHGYKYQIVHMIKLMPYCMSYPNKKTNEKKVEEMGNNENKGPVYGWMDGIKTQVKDFLYKGGINATTFSEIWGKEININMNINLGRNLF